MTARCIPNIGPAGRRRRLKIGVAMFLVGTLAVVGTLAWGVPPLWRLPVFLPFWVAAVALLQVRSRTCIVLAARGTEDLDAGERPIGDASRLAQIRAQARAIRLRATLIAVLVTLAVLALPTIP